MHGSNRLDESRSVSPPARLRGCHGCQRATRAAVARPAAAQRSAVEGAPAASAAQFIPVISYFIIWNLITCHIRHLKVEAIPRLGGCKV